MMTPYGILKIETESGETLYAFKATEAPRVIAHKHADAVTYMMEDVVKFGTGQRAQTGFPVAGKTGTTQDYRDALFIGFSSVYTMGVWMGNDDNSSMERMFGGTLPAEIWRQSMARAHRGVGAAPVSNYQPGETGEFKSFLNGLFSGGRTSPSENSRNAPRFQGADKPSHRLNN